MWTLNGIRIFVQDFQESNRQIIARLQPVNTHSVHQEFGYESVIYKLKGLVVGTTDKDALLNLAKTGATYTLAGPYESFTSLYVLSVNHKGTMSTCQTLRTDLDENAPVYEVEVELYKDE